MRLDVQISDLEFPILGEVRGRVRGHLFFLLPPEALGGRRGGGPPTGGGAHGTGLTSGPREG